MIRLDQNQNESINLIAWKKHATQIIQLGKPGSQGVFSDKFTQDINGFTDEPAVQCDFEL